MISTRDWLDKSERENFYKLTSKGNDVSSVDLHCVNLHLIWSSISYINGVWPNVFPCSLTAQPELV